MSILTGNKFDPNKDIPDLSGKTYIITGGTAGIGFGITAHVLQHKPAKIYLLSAKEHHAAEAQEALEKYGDINTLEWRQCNFESLKQTDQVAKQVAKELSSLDGLVCNAGLGVGAHLALTLLPILQKTTDSRLVFQSSDLHKAAPSSVEFASVHEMNQDIGAMLLYNRTKLAQVLFMRELVKRMQAGQFGNPSGSAGQPWINATHPGGVKTDQQAQAVEAYGTLGKIGVAAVRPFMKDPVDEGCRSALFASTSLDVVKERIQGQYIVPDRKVTDVSKQAQDEKLAQNLWNLTKEILESKIGALDYIM